MGVPLLSLGETLGMIVLTHTRPKAFTPEDRSVAQAMADVCATAIRNVQLADELRRVTNTDGLTGVAGGAATWESVRAALPGDVPAAEKTVQDLAKAGISMDQVTRQLEDEGLKLFTASYDDLMKSLDEKKEKLKIPAR